MTHIEALLDEYNERYQSLDLGLMELLNSIMTFRLKYKFWLTIMLLMICQTVCGQFVYDRSNMTIGKIDSNGYVYNRSNMTIGRIKSDGYIMDRSNMTIGRIMNDGRIMDRSNMMIGKVESDGYVKDRSNMTVGRIKPDGYVVDRSNMTIGRAKGIPITYAAVYFFFNKFGY